MGKDVIENRSDKEILNFNNVTNFMDFTNLVFSLNDPSRVRAMITNQHFGRKPSETFLDKFELLSSHFENIWDPAIITSLSIFDDEGNEYDLKKIAQRLNGGDGSGYKLTQMSNEERIEIVKNGWLIDSRRRTTELANQIGGVVVPINDWDWEVGVHSLIVFQEVEKKGDVKRLFRGIWGWDGNDLDRQVCPMLRTGKTANGKDAFGPVGMRLGTEIIRDPEIVGAVIALAREPNEKGFLQVIDLYKKYGYDFISEEAEYALKGIKEKMSRDPEETFEEGMMEFHRDLMRGNVGHSPYLAASRELKGASIFSGLYGMILILDVDKGMSKPSSGTYESEEFVFGGVNRKNIVALLPINIVNYDINADNAKRNQLKTEMDHYQEEVLGILEDYTEPKKLPSAS
jgi:hypothetical protein